MSLKAGPGPRRGPSKRGAAGALTAPASRTHCLNTNGGTCRGVKTLPCTGARELAQSTAPHRCQTGPELQSNTEGLTKYKF